MSKADLSLMGQSASGLNFHIDKTAASGMRMTPLLTMQSYAVQLAQLKKIYVIFQINFL
jgi:hypothetical protein